jgi:MFS family permease
MSAPASVVSGRLDRNALLGIGAAIGAISAVGTSLSLGLPLLGIVLEQRGVSSSAIGINSAMAGVASVITTPFVPKLAARVGAARLLAALVLLATLTFPLFYVFEDYWAWIFLRFVFHGAINGAFILSEFWINALAPPKKRGLILGIYATVLSLGFAVGPVILALVGSEGAAPFLIGTAVLGLSVIPVFAALGADPSMEGGSGHSFARYLLLVPLATFAALVMGATESGVMSFIAIYGLRLGYEERMAALLVTAVAVGNVVSQIPLGMISDRVDRRKLLLAIAVVGTGLSALIPLAAADTVLLVAVLAAWGGVAAGLYTVGLAHLGARLTGSDLASANAAFIFMYSIGMLAGPTSIGAGMDVWNPHGLAVVAAAFLGAYAVLAAVRIRTVPRQG